MEKPKCGECIHRRSIPGDAHSACANLNAQVTADRYGVEQGWFFWPLNFDPSWLKTCTGFEAVQKPAPTPSPS